MATTSTTTTATISTTTSAITTTITAATSQLPTLVDHMISQRITVNHNQLRSTRTLDLTTNKQRTTMNNDEPRTVRSLESLDLINERITNNNEPQWRTTNNDEPWTTMNHERSRNHHLTPKKISGGSALNPEQGLPLLYPRWTQNFKLLWCQVKFERIEKGEEKREKRWREDRIIIDAGNISNI